MILVLPIIKLTAVLAQRVRFIVALWLKNEARIEQHLDNAESYTSVISVGTTYLARVGVD